MPLRATRSYADMAEGFFDEFAHRVALASRKHVIVRRILLQDQPHSLDKIACMTPVTASIEIAEEQLLLQPALDRGHRTRDLARHEGFAADRTLMVGEDLLVIVFSGRVRRRAFCCDLGNRS
jgi:hypothetical protein